MVAKRPSLVRTVIILRQQCVFVGSLRNCKQTKYLICIVKREISIEKPFEDQRHWKYKAVSLRIILKSTRRLRVLF